MKIQDMSPLQIRDLLDSFKNRGIDLKLTLPGLFANEEEHISYTSEYRYPEITELGSYTSFRIKWDEEFDVDSLGDSILKRQRESIRQSESSLATQRALLKKTEMKIKGLLVSTATEVSKNEEQ